jgi:predicted transcriptional regulator
MKNEQKYIKAFTEKSSAKQKRLRSGKFVDLESELNARIEESIGGNIPITGTLVQNIAKDVAKDRNISGFKASNGWLNRYKKRESLSTQKVCGESNSVSSTIIEDWKNNKLSAILKDYEPKNIFNCDEFGLFYKMLPKKSLNFKGKQCKGGKFSKERITGFFNTNMNGSEKEKLVFIGKFAKPRCFKNVKVPIKYYSNKASWMTTIIFEDIMKNFNEKMARQGRHVLLFSDNCSTHKLKNKFSHVKIIFLPANTTSVLQPLDQGVIHSFKSIYRGKLAKKYLEIIREAKLQTDYNPQTFNIQFDLMDAIILAKHCWDLVSQETIENCFKKSGFGSNTETSPEVVLFKQNKQLQQNLDQLTEELGEDPISYNDYISCDDSLKTSEVYREELIQDIYDGDTEIEGDGSDIEVVEEIELEEIIPTNLEVLNMVQKLNKWFLSRDWVADGSFEAVNTLEEKIHATRNNNLKQKLILDYFPNK